MRWIGLALAAVLTAELLIRLPLLRAIGTIGTSARKAQWIVASGAISDHWKERILPAYALRIGLGSVHAFSWLLLALSPFAILGLVWSGGFEALCSFLLDWRVILGLSLLSAIYVWIRVRFRRSTEAPAERGGSEKYDAAAKLLHYMALGSPVLPEMLHDIERTMHLKGATDATAGAHVFVTGLARAGTTMLFRELHETGQFATLTYADMPFVLAPNLWAQVARSKDPGDMHERAHGDGILINAESPEAFDEVYWRVMDEKAYIRSDRLLPHRPDEEIVRGFTDYMALILKRRGKARYLSKNNNNILRLLTLVKAYPNAVFLVPVREPLQHAASLLRQHQRFSNSDAFTADYMRWLGHHEFGRTHLPFAFSGRPDGDPETLDYWLRIWIAAHLTILKIDAPNLHVLEPNVLLASPAMRDRLAALLNLPAVDPKNLRAISPTEVPEHDPALQAEASAIFAALRARAL